MKRSKETRPDKTQVNRRTVVKGIGAAAALGSAVIAAPAIVRRASAADPIRVGVI